MANRKRTKNDLQNVIQKTLDRATPSPIVFVFSLFISLQHSIKRLQLECPSL